MYKTDSGSDPYYFVSNFQFRKKLNAALKNLYKRDKDIIFLWFGMYSEEKTLQLIGEQYEISGSRAAQLKDRGIKKLRKLMQ